MPDAPRGLATTPGERAEERRFARTLLRRLHDEARRHVESVVDVGKDDPQRDGVGLQVCQDDVPPKRRHEFVEHRCAVDGRPARAR